MMTFDKFASLPRGLIEFGFGQLRRSRGQCAVADPNRTPVGVKVDRAVVMSFYPHGGTPGAVRINLKWQGNHQVSDFKLDALGEVLDYQTETERTGWVTLHLHGDLHVQAPFFSGDLHLAGLRRGDEFRLL